MIHVLRKISVTLLVSAIVHGISGPTNIYAQVSEPDSLQLISIYNSTDGPNWQTNANWLNTRVGLWAGIEVANGRVSEINLSNFGLRGQLPSEIGDLNGLSKLILDHNQLTATVPGEIGNLGSLLQLNLGSNDLSGSIPVEIGDLALLSDLNLSGNELSGSIPAELGIV
ncbi:MAG: hypothetical protein IH853_07780 [Bacteroidetes bacterium]|nr:hypothetical protein [Bacteroidota bacterium]